MNDVKRNALINMIECADMQAEDDGKDCAMVLLTREDLQEIARDMHKADRYKWHDLRKNPNDLPENKKDVLAVVDRISADGEGYSRRYVVMNYNYHKKPFSEKCIGWGHSIYTIYEYEIDEVIAWKYIDPFEEGE